MPLRLDTAEIPKVTRTDSGFLRAPARLTKVGVFPYWVDGRVRQEYRPAEEVFASEALASYALLPVTDDHPYHLKGKVNADNSASVVVGTLGEVVRQDGDYAEATMQLTEKTAIAKVDAGQRQISLGYDCKIDPTPGVFNGQSYDVVQRNIRANHVALVKMGRMGADVELRLDSADGFQVTSDFKQPVARQENSRGANVKPTIRLDGVDFEVSPEAMQAFAKVEQAQKDSASKFDKLTARADAADAELKELKAKLATAQDPKLFQAAVASRIALEGKAKELVGPDFKMDGLDDQAVMVAALQKRFKDFEPKGKSADYIHGRFEALTPATETKTIATERFDSAEGDKGAVKPKNYHEAHAAHIQAMRQVFVDANKVK